MNGHNDTPVPSWANPRARTQDIHSLRARYINTVDPLPNMSYKEVLQSLPPSPSTPSLPPEDVPPVVPPQNLLPTAASIHFNPSSALEGEEVVIASNGEPMVKLVPVAKKGRLRGWGKLKGFRNAVDIAFTSEIDEEVARSLKGQS